MIFLSKNKELKINIVISRKEKLPSLQEQFFTNSMTLFSELFQ